MQLGKLTTVYRPGMQLHFTTAVVNNILYRLIHEILAQLKVSQTPS